MNQQSHPRRNGLSFLGMCAVITLLASSGCRGASASGSHTAQPRPAKKAASVLVFGLDMSESTGRNRSNPGELVERRCAEVQEALKVRVLETPTRPVKVQILQTGLANQAILTVVPWTEVGGRNGAPRVELPVDAARRLEQQVQVLTARCRTSAQPSDSSPIYALAEATVQSADAECRGSCERSEVRLHSDGSEGGPLGQRWLKDALEGSRARAMSARAQAIPADRVLKTGATVVMCGFSEAVAPMAKAKNSKGWAPLTLGERQAVWRAVVSAAELRFEPACGRGQAQPSAGEQGLVKVVGL